MTTGRTLIAAEVKQTQQAPQGARTVSIVGAVGTSAPAIAAQRAAAAFRQALATAVLVFVF
jgi:hypothetical protein